MKIANNNKIRITLIKTFLDLSSNKIKRKLIYIKIYTKKFT